MTFGCLDIRSIHRALVVLAITAFVLVTSSQPSSAQAVPRIDFKDFVGQAVPDSTVSSSQLFTALERLLKKRIAQDQYVTADAEELLRQLRPARNDVSTHGRIRVFAFEQFIGENPVSGPGSRLTIALDPDGKIIGGAGHLIVAKPSQQLKVDREKAARTAEAAWLKHLLKLENGRPYLPDTGKRSSLSTEIVEKPLIDYRNGQPMVVAEVSTRGALAARVYLSPYDLSVQHVQKAYYEDAFDHHPVHVLATIMSNDPSTHVPTLYAGLPGSSATTPVWCFQAPWLGYCFLQMGDDKLFAYNFNNNPNASTLPTRPLTYKYYRTSSSPAVPGPIVPYAQFLNTDTQTFRMQDSFVKMVRARELLDAIKQPAGWDHTQGAPFGVFERPPLMLFENVPGAHPYGPGSTGVFWEVSYSGAAQAGWESIGHPHFGFRQGSIALTDAPTNVVFHEMGHFYDYHSSLGVVGQDMNATSCLPDTIDESVPLAETIADMFSLYAARKLYPGLSYTGDTLPAASQCRFSAIAGGLTRIPHEDCISNNNQIWHFDDERPGANANTACQPGPGYRLGSMQQAMWKFMHGVNCQMTMPLNCSIETTEPSDIMGPMLYALSLSNYYSYQDFFDAIRVGILVNAGAAEAARFESIFSDHGLL